MTEFWITAGLMTLVAFGFIAWPVLRAQAVTGKLPLVALAPALLLIPSAVLLYRQVTTWTGTEPVVAASNEQLAIVAQLAARMQQTPDDVEGWLLLGRSYLTLQHFAEARQAFLQAWQRMPNPSDDLKLGLAIATIYTDRDSIATDAGRLIEEVLASDPSNQQALFYGGLVAVERGRNDLARDRWTQLLALGPPPDAARFVEQQIAMLGEGAIGSASAVPSSSAGAAGATAPAASAGPVIRINVALGDGVATDPLGPNAALFIFARAQAGGPPLAVIREPATAVPGEFTLSNANTMIQGNTLDRFEELTIVARLSRSGQPTESSGDIFASTIYDMTAGGDVELTLDQIVP